MHPKRLKKVNRIVKTRFGRLTAKATLAASLSMTLVLSGCGAQSDRLPVQPVSGTVTFKGKPLSNALVAFHPVDNSDPRATACRATSDANGKFTLSTYDANDGAPAGEYKVTVECYKLKGSGTSLEPGPNFLPVKYSRPATTKLTVRVEEGAPNSPALAID